MATTNSKDLIETTKYILKIVTDTDNIIKSSIVELEKVEKIITDLRTKDGANAADLNTKAKLEDSKRSISKDLQGKLQSINTPIQTSSKKGGKYSSKKQIDTMISYVSDMIPTSAKKTQKKRHSRKH